MCNCIHEILNVFEDSAQREHTKVASHIAIATTHAHVSKNDTTSLEVYKNSRDQKLLGKTIIISKHLAIWAEKRHVRT